MIWTIWERVKSATIAQSFGAIRIGSRQTLPVGKVDLRRITRMKQLRALDLFCGAGGATKGLQRAGFHVTGVDIEPMPRYCGDEFHQAGSLARKSWRLSNDPSKVDSWNVENRSPDRVVCVPRIEA